MKKFLALSAMTLLMSANAVAHDEGHGPKLADTGKYGGLVSSIVAKADAGKGTKATLIYKAELVRSADGNINVYVYDSNMKAMDLKAFDTKGSASLAAKVKGKWKTVTFDLAAKDNSFEGKMPKPEGKPYNIDVTIKENDKELLSAFDNLD